MEELKLEDAKKTLLVDDDNEIRYKYPENLFLFLEILTSAISKDVGLDELIFTIELLVKDLEKEKCGFYNSSVTQKKFNELISRFKVYDDLYQVLSYIPRYIEQVTNPEFSREFSKDYGASILGQYNILEPKQDYGYIDLENGKIDISNKDKAEVLAELYNNSKPQGLGMAQYDPAPMPIEIARKLLDRTQRFDYLKGRPVKINLEGNIIYVGAYNYDNGKGLAESVISSCKNINDLGKGRMKTTKKEVEEDIREMLEKEIDKKNKEKLRTQSQKQSSGLDYLRVDLSEMQPMRRLIEETGHDISDETLEFVKMVENRAYSEEMKMMQDVEDIEELEDVYEYYLDELTIARNNDWYIIYGEDEDSVEVVDIASLPERDNRASQEIHNYMTGVINKKAKNGNKPVTLNAKEDTSYRMILRMVSNGEYEIVEDTENFWNDNNDIKMHNLVLRPIIERDRME